LEQDHLAGAGCAHTIRRNIRIALGIKADGGGEHQSLRYGFRNTVLHDAHDSAAARLRTLFTEDGKLRVTYHRLPRPGYGDVPDCYASEPDEATAIWQPEFSLGQLYNKGLFLLGYYNEVNEFARSILENRRPSKGGLDHVWQVTRLFEAFAEGSGQRIELEAR